MPFGPARLRDRLSFAAREVGVVRWIGFAVGVVLIVGAGGSMTRTLVIPRGITSRLASRVERLTRALFLFVAGRFRHFRTKDHILALHGPITMLGLLLTWIVTFVIGYALLLWPLAPNESILDALRSSGSALFTLGFETPGPAAATFIHFVAAATGLVVVALQIAYLPQLYAAFNRRETLVTTLQSRAGVPAWGPEILARHRLVDLMDNLPAFYSEWELWAADVAESHSNYPILISFRSPHPLRSWVLALLSVMDSAALYCALAPSRAPSEARITIRMGFTALRDVAAAIGLPFDADPLPTDPIQLTYDDFLLGIKRLEQAGFPMERTAEEAWPHFHGWRVNYESIAYALADRVVAAPALWSGPRRHVPDLTIQPLRPIDRRPGDAETLDQPRAQTEWRL